MVGFGAAGMYFKIRIFRPSTHPTVLPCKGLKILPHPACGHHLHPQGVPISSENGEGRGGVYPPRELPTPLLRYTIMVC